MVKTDKQKIEQARQRGKFWLAREIDPQKLDGYTVVFHLERETKELKSIQVTNEEVPAVCLPKSHRVCKHEAFELFHDVEDAIVDFVSRGTSVRSLKDLNGLAATVAESWLSDRRQRPLASQDPLKKAEEAPPLYDPPVFRKPVPGARSLGFSWFLPGKPGEEFAITGFELELYAYDFDEASDGLRKVQLGETVKLSDWERSYTFDGLRGSRQHWCRVRAVDDKGWKGEWSSELGAKTKTMTIAKTPATMAEKMERVQESIREAQALQKAKRFARQQMIQRGLCHDGEPIKSLKVGFRPGDLSYSVADSRSPSRSPVPRASLPAADATVASADRTLVEGRPADIFTLTDMVNDQIPAPVTTQTEPNPAIASIARARKIAREALNIRQDEQILLQ